MTALQSPQGSEATFNFFSPEKILSILKEYPLVVQRNQVLESINTRTKQLFENASRGHLPLQVSYLKERSLNLIQTSQWGKLKEELERKPDLTFSHLDLTIFYARSLIHHPSNEFLPKADKILSDIIQNDKDSVSARYAKIEYCKRTGKIFLALIEAQALKMALEGLGVFSWDSTMFITIGQIYLEMSNFREALETIEEGLRWNPSDPNLLMFKEKLRSTLFKQNDQSESLK